MRNHLKLSLAAYAAAGCKTAGSFIIKLSLWEIHSAPRLLVFCIPLLAG
jgi:hypothetical protein